MALAEYLRKRDFRRTPEPAGKTARRPGYSFVVQKHAASRLHYDFRLELNGVLKSWAVPKGPSLDPTQKRLAVHVEDHPVEYGSFEGVIPEGEYGGGTVLLWDRGSWEPTSDPHEGFRQGKLKFQLHGEKLRGGWYLVRRSGSRTAQDNKTWFLIKQRDEEAKPVEEGDILEEQQQSVATGRDLPEIAAQRDRTWKSKPSSNGKHARGKRSSARHAKGANKVVRRKPPKVEEPPGSKSKNALPTIAGDEFAGVRLTSANKILYPEQGITKLDLASYYYSIADWILPHIAGRPLVLVRCPEGRSKPCFFQKHPTVGSPQHLRQIPVREKHKTEKYLVVDDVAGLISLAQIGALEIHMWGSREDKLQRPDRLVFDLDPDPAVPWTRVVEAAQQIRRFLKDLELESFVKTTGGKGLHLVVPIQRRHEWDEVKEICHSIARLVVAAAPQHYTSHMSKAARGGKIFIDYLRNGRGATSVAAYSTRAKAGAPVSTPLTWDELTSIKRSDEFNLRTLPQRLASLRRDPWAGIDDVQQGLTAGLKKTLASLGKVKAM